MSSRAALICAIICSVLKCCWFIAPDGHAPTQVPHPLHNAVLICANSFPPTPLAIAIAPYGHNSTHTWHAPQMNNRFDFYFSFSHWDCCSGCCS